MDGINWTNAKKQSLGVEIEMSGIKRPEAAKIAAELFGTNRFGDTHYENGYCAWSAWDSKGREWKFTRDVSIKAVSDDYKCELATPILHYEDDIETLQELVRRLRKAGAKSSPAYGCGVHIHVGAHDHVYKGESVPGFTGKDVRNLVNLMYSKEDLLIKAVDIADERVYGAATHQPWCAKVDANFLKAINEQKPVTLADTQRLWYKVMGGDPNAHYAKCRYRMLNLHSIARTHTIEFRLFNFWENDENRKYGLHAGMIRSFILLVLGMTQYAKEARFVKAQKTQLENANFAMRIWMNHMGMIGEEFETPQDIFRRKLSGNATHRFGDRD